MSFKFEKEQRVTVPGVIAQAVILDATETVPGFPVYTIRWLDVVGETHTGTVGEGDLATYNPASSPDRRPISRDIAKRTAARKRKR